MAGSVCGSFDGRMLHGTQEAPQQITQKDAATAKEGGTPGNGGPSFCMGLVWGMIVRSQISLSAT